jgi:membrane protein
VSPAGRKRPLDLSGSGMWQIGKAAWKESGQDNLALIASGVAFYIFLAFVPLLMSVVLTYGLVASPAQVAKDISALSSSMPKEASSIISGQLENIVKTAGGAAGFGLFVSLLVSLYGATKAAGGMVTALNVAFDVEETRSFIRVTLLTLAITVGIVLAFVVASFGLSVVNFLGRLLPDAGGVIHFLLQAVYWLGTAVAISLIIAALYRYAPNVPDRPWRWVTPGSIVATVVWVAATFAFSFYVKNFGSYNATYGSLAAVIIFLTWLYLSAYIVLLGAELNSVIERAKGAHPQEREGSSKLPSP